MKKALLILLTFASFQLVNAQFSIQKAVVEEFTGAWCGYCPEGALIVDQIHNNDPKMIPVAIHSGDAMDNADGADIVSFYSPSYPQATINRSSSPISRGSWASAVAGATAGASVVSVSINNVTYNVNTRELSFEVGGQFTAAVTGDLRFGAILTEDHLVGTGNGWDQVNYFNTTQGHAFQGMGDPILNYEHNHVYRAAIGGVWGTSGIIPATVAFGQSFTHTYTFTMNANWKPESMDLVAYVARFDGNGSGDREILNGEEFSLTPLVLSMDPITAQSDFIQVAPNPINDISKVMFTLRESGNIRMEVMNMMGEHIATLGEGHMNAGAHTLNWDGTDNANRPAANGAYLIRLVTEHGQSATTKILLQH